MPREINIDVKRQFAERFLMDLFDNLQVVLNSELLERPEYSTINDIGLMKAALFMTAQHRKPTANNTRRFIEELLPEFTQYLRERGITFSEGGDTLE